ncbi:unnamed protein product [Moneuplotes crassus]|uniref:protein-serine/threonine phosphatase n=1 Tax=Euplotes crassus TaxID=5936 RepID=A0AAD1UBM7_EUPCR|nr:unnamed protein product [Moneuplotes crassus]
MERFLSFRKKIQEENIDKLQTPTKPQPADYEEKKEPKSSKRECSPAIKSIIKNQEECLCEEIFNEMCLKCGKVRNSTFFIDSQDTHKTFKLLSDEIQYTERLALVKEKELKDSLLKERKLTLILDLDNTILHSTTGAAKDHDPKFFGRVFPGKNIFQLPVKPEEGIVTQTKIRPFLKEFIQMVSPLFKIYIYTMGNRSYANLVAKVLNKEIPHFKIDPRWVISRDDGHQHTDGGTYKTLRQLSPTDHSFFLILDDRADVWPGAADNLLRIAPYVYFPTHEADFMLKSLPRYYRLYIKEDVDPFLLYYGRLLKEMHCKYFEVYDKEGKSDNLDIRNIRASVTKDLFKGIHCAYLSFFPTQTAEQMPHSYEWTSSSERGMINTHEYQSGATNVVVTNSWDLDDSVFDQAKTDQCPIVPAFWLHMSILLNTVLPLDIYNLGEHFKLSEPEQDKSSDKQEQEAAAKARADRLRTIMKDRYLKIIEDLLTPILKSDFDIDYQEHLEAARKVDKEYQLFKRKMDQKRARQQALDDEASASEATVKRRKTSEHDTAEIKGVDSSTSKDSGAK